MRRDHAILANVAALAMIGGARLVRVDEDGGEDVLLADEREPHDIPRHYDTRPKKPEPKVHTHSREIARRLRQEARKLQKSLPDGLYVIRGKIMFYCAGCDGMAEWIGEIEDFDPEDPKNMCGGSPRCCP